MGSDAMLCIPGYPTRNSAFGQELEKQGYTLKRHYREGSLAFSLSLEDLHRAVDHAVDGRAEDAQLEIDRGLARIDESSRHVEGLAQGVRGWNDALAHHAEVDPSEPLVVREKHLRELPYEALYQELTLGGAALPRRVLWQEVTEALRTGGTPSGLRILIKTLRRLQGQLRTYVATVEDHRRLPPLEMAEALHSMSIEGASVQMSWTILLVQATYVAFLTERATHLHESEMAATA